MADATSKQAKWAKSIYDALADRAYCEGDVHGNEYESEYGDPLACHETGTKPETWCTWCLAWEAVAEWRKRLEENHG